MTSLLPFQRPSHGSPTHLPDLIATFAQIQIYCAGLKIWIYCRNLKSKFKWSITWSGGSCIERFIPVIRPRPCLCTIIQPTAFHWTVAIFLHIVLHFTEHYLQFSEMLLIICTLVWILLNFILHFAELLLDICTLVCISLNFILQCSELHFISVHFNESEAVSAHSQ